MRENPEAVDGLDRASKCPMSVVREKTSANPEKSAFSGRMPNGSNRIFSLIPSVIFAVSLAVTHQLHKREIESAEIETKADFETKTFEIRTKIEERMKYYESVLHGARIVFTSLSATKRQDFHHYMADLNLEAKYPGIQGVSFAPKVSGDALADLVDSQRKNGFLDYAVNPTGNREFHTPVVIIEPLTERNLKAMGHDPFSDPVRRAVMEKSLETNQAVITNSLKLVQEGKVKQQSGFLMYLPVFGQNAAHDTLEERRKNVSGWLAASFRVDDLMRGLSGDGFTANLDIEIYDGISTDEQDRMFDSKTDNTHSSRFKTVEKIDLSNHSWTIKITSDSVLEDKIRNGKPTAVVVSGIGASVFLSIFSWFLISGRRRALDLARRMNHDLIESESRLRTLVDKNMDAIVRIDENGVVIEWGGRSEAIFEYSEAEAIGKKVSDLIVPEKSRAFHNAAFDDPATFDPKTSVFCDRIMEMSALRKSGEEFPIEITVSHVPWNGKNEFCSFIRDISERKIASMKILEMATHDSLTGLPNRNLLNDRLNQAIKVANRTGKSCGVIFIDIDRFKPVNDVFGHKVGDQLLKQISERLLTIMRAEDTVARFWGDEFVIVVPELDSEDALWQVSEKITKAINAPFYIERNSISVGVSIGCSTCPRDGKNADELLLRSDEAMYRSKKGVKGS